jgi:hypothetical protein
MWGRELGPEILPDDQPAPRPPPSGSSRRRAGRTPRQRVLAEATAFVRRSLPAPGTVLLRPELQDLESDAAKSVMLRHIPRLVNATVRHESGGLMAGGLARADAGSLFATPREQEGFFELVPPVVVEPNKVREPEQGTKATPTGLLPLDGALASHRSDLDRHFTTRQRFDLRAAPDSARAAPPRAAPPAPPAAPPAPPAAPPAPPAAPPRQGMPWSAHHDFGAAPVHLRGAECARRNVKALIEDKVRWGRGRGPEHPAPGAPSGVAGGVRQLALAPAPPVPPEERAQRREKEKEKASYRPARAEERAAALQEAAAQRARRAAEARARKAAREEEYRQWQRGVALRIDDAAQLEAKAERERERGLALWLGGVKAWAFLAAVGPRVLAERVRRTQEQEMLRAALRVQSTFRCFIQLRIFNARLRRIKMLCEELRPKMSMFLLR